MTEERIITDADIAAAQEEASALHSKYLGAVAGVQELRRRQRNQRRAKEHSERDALRAKLEQEHGITPGTDGAQKLWDKAWDEGHSEGLQRVADCYEELADIVNAMK